MSERTDRETGARLNGAWGVGAAHALYIHDGDWYHHLKRFPGALFDRNGYILFETEADYRNCPHISLGKDVSVPKPGISAIPGYIRVIRSVTTLPEEVSPDDTFPDGGAVQIRVNRYERDDRARKACIRHYGPKCVVCGFDFASTYGAVLKGFIHVHHLTPLATVGRAYRVNPVRDLRPVCANCHAVVHRREPAYTVEQVRAMVQHKRHDA